MKKFFTMITACFLMSMLYGAPGPFPSPGTWYYIKFAQRQWPQASTLDSRYLYDYGSGNTLIVTEPLAATADGLQWKIEEIGTSGQYRIVSKLGNGIEFTSTPLENVRGDRYYTSSTSTAEYTITVVNTDYYILKRVGGNGIDKSNNTSELDAYGSGAGVSVEFVPVVGTTLNVSTTPSLKFYTESTTNPTPSTIAAFSAFEDGKDAKYGTVIAYNLTPGTTVTAEFTGENPGLYSLSQNTFTVNNDGLVVARLEVSFTPAIGTGAGSYPAKLKLSSSAGSTSDVEISLTGTVTGGVPVKISSVDNQAEFWYYVVTPLRTITGNVFTDKSTGGAVVVLEQALAVRNDDTQLWKITRDAAGQYRFVNKATGNQIDYNGAGDDKFSVGPTSTRTFSFVKWTGTLDLDYYCIMCNDQGQLNKANSSTNAGFGSWTSNNDTGNATRFVSVDDPELALYLAWDKPAFSTDGNDTWYQIRVAKNRKVWQDAGENQNVLQQAAVDDLDSQKWKFTEESDGSVKIVSKAGYEVGYSSNRYLSVTSGAGSVKTFVLQKNPLETHWMLKDGNTFVNDASGNGLELGQYFSTTDTGSIFTFSKINSQTATGVQSDKADGEVVSVKYYTLFGVEIPSPPATGIYIVKKTFASGKTQAAKYISPTR